MVIVNGAAAGVGAAGLAHCRKGDVENCTAHYGAAWGTFAAATGLTVVALPLTAKMCFDFGYKWMCYGLGYTGAAYQFAWGINEWHQYAPETDPSASLRIKPLWLHVKR